MRFKTSLLASSAIVASCSFGQAAPVRKITPHGAVSFTSQLYKFAVWMPHKIDHDPLPFPEEGGGTYSLFSFGTATSPIRYEIYATSSPKPDTLKPEKRLDALQKLLVEPGEILRKRQDIQVDGFPGRDLTISLTQSKQTIRARIYLTPNTTYQILVTAKESTVQDQSKQINKVFDSFRILPH